MYMVEYLMYIFEEQMCTFGYLEIPNIILSLVSFFTKIGLLTYVLDQYMINETVYMYLISI